MDRDKRLDNAYRCLRKRRHVEAIKCIEPLIAGGYDPYPLFIAGCAYLDSDRIDMAIPIIRRLRSSFPDYIPGKELDLFVLIKSAERMEDATVACMNISPTGRDAVHFKRLEKKIRRTGDFHAFQKKLHVSDCVRIRRYHPRGIFAITRQPRSGKDQLKRRKKIAIIPFAVLVFVMITVVSISIIYTMKIKFHSIKPVFKESEKIDMLVLPENRYPLTGKISKNDRYNYNTEEELRNDFEFARKLAKEGKYNDSLLLLNRILLSNAQPGVIGRAEFLRDYVIHAENRPAEIFSFSRIRKEPELYRGVMIKFRGTVSRKNTGDTGSSFSIKTGGETAETVEIFYKGKLETVVGDTIKGEGIFYQLIGEKRQLYIEAHVIENE